MWFIALSTVLLLSTLVNGEGRCQPSTWTNKRSLVVAGGVNCRYEAVTGKDVDYYTCTQLAEDYHTTFEKLRELNPSLDKDCSNIKPKTSYCVHGFVEPERAHEGKCGPPHGNLVCAGTEKQCCNSKTWTCGNSAEDCETGVCYEGACLSAKDDNITLNGKCGPNHGDTVCGGKWGDCCDHRGVCGSGRDFCSEDKCWSGKCTMERSYLRVNDL